MGKNQIRVKGTVKHKDKDFEMTVLKVDKNWVTCEYANHEGEREIKCYASQFLEILNQPSGMNINTAELDAAYNKF